MLRTLPLLAIALSAGAAPLAGQQTPVPLRPSEAWPAPAPVRPDLAAGSRIRIRGEAVDHLGRPTGGDFWRYGLIGAYVYRGRAEGTVLLADPDSLVFTDLKRGGVVALDWDRLDAVEVFTGRDPARGALEGGIWGLLAGVAVWGAMEAIYSDDRWYVDGGSILALSVASGAVGGALTLGERWEAVYPEPPRR